MLGEYMSEAVTFKPSRFNIFHEGSKGSYLYNTYSTGLIRVNPDTEIKIKKVFDQPKDINILTDKEISALSENGFLVSPETDEIEQIKFRYFQGVYDNKQIKIVLVPT
jgi:hypothetical protein